MKVKLCFVGWDQYCEDEDGYESKASDDYEVDVDEYIKTGDPTQELPKDKRGYYIVYLSRKCSRMVGWK